MIGIRRRRGPASGDATDAAGLTAPAAEPAGGPLGDAELAARSRVDPESFGLLYDRYADQIYRYVHKRIWDRETAEDVTAEVFVKALRAIDSYRPDRAPFAAWLYRIAGNAIIDHLRASRSTLSLDLAADEVDTAEPVEEQAITRLEVARVWSAVDRLTEAQRAAVMLRLGDDLPIAEIAARLDRSEGAVKLLLNRGLAAVRDQLATPAPAAAGGAGPADAAGRAGRAGGAGGPGGGPAASAGPHAGREAPR